MQVLNIGEGDMHERGKLEKYAKSFTVTLNSDVTWEARTRARLCERARLQPRACASARACNCVPV